jgi:hypothetical protein
MYMTCRTIIFVSSSSPPPLLRQSSNRGGGSMVKHVGSVSGRAVCIANIDSILLTGTLHPIMPYALASRPALLI